jgi:HpcH/HpaI aldolase/citrate lyase family
VREGGLNTVPFSLIYFSTQPIRIAEAVAAGVDTAMVDCEYLGKVDRQAGADTQINHDTMDDLRRVRECTPARIACRINRFHHSTAREVEEAIGIGADEIFLPMVRTVQEVESVLRLVDGRRELSILVETNAAVECSHRLAQLPVSRVYVGLNDLAIDRGSLTIFEALADGTVEQVRREFSVPFGFGGLTLPDRGSPIPCRLLIAEMARLECSFSFLRRSFTRDTAGYGLQPMVSRIRSALLDASARNATEVHRDQMELLRTLHSGPLLKEASA